MGANGTPSGPSTSFSSARMSRASSAGDDDDDGDGDGDGKNFPEYAMPTSSTIIVDVDSSWEVVAVVVVVVVVDDDLLATPFSVVGEG